MCQLGSRECGLALTPPHALAPSIDQYTSQVAIVTGAAGVLGKAITKCVRALIYSLLSIYLDRSPPVCAHARE